MGFIEDTRESFRLVKDDFIALKESMNDWILYLNTSNRRLKNEVRELEHRISMLETKKNYRDEEEE